MKCNLQNLRTVACLSAVFFAATAQGDYIFDITTAYAFTNPIPGTNGNFTDFGGPSPDTGFWNVTNSGTSTFFGTIGQNAVAGSTDFSYSHILTLAPGNSVSFAVNSESSNFGGFNGPSGSTQPGVKIFISGLINGVDAISLSVFDRDIHSGIFATNPFGESLDNYVLQGGDSLGRDTGDNFENAQAAGHFQFASITKTVPDGGGTMVLFTSALTGIAALRGRIRM